MIMLCNKSMQKGVSLLSGYVIRVRKDKVRSKT